MAHETIVAGRKDNFFKSLTISKIFYSALLPLIPNSVVEELKQILKTFLWGNRRGKKPPKKHNTSPPTLPSNILHNIYILIPLSNLKIETDFFFQIYLLRGKMFIPFLVL